MITKAKMFLIRSRSKSKERKQHLSGQKIVHRQDANSESTLYFGNNNSQTLHLPECHIAKKISDSVIFISRERAVNLGYIPCKLCNP
jgi:micrococcal nuclease